MAAPSLTDTNSRTEENDLKSPKQPDMDPGKQADMDPGKQPDMDPGKQPDMDPGKQPDMDPGKQPDMDPGKQPDMDPGKQPDMDPGKQPDMDPGKQPDMDPGKQPDRCSELENEASEPEEPFKKPTLLANKRGNVAASGPAERGDLQAAGGSSESGQARDGETERKPRKLGPKPKAVPVQGPPAGKVPPLPYTEPVWGGAPPDLGYALEILKNGTVIDSVPLTSSVFVVGRLPVCDVSLEHPSISRYHAVLQYRDRAGRDGCVGEERGFYLHDLGSTHGSLLNKCKVPARTHVRIRVGHVLKFGGSTRLFVLQGPEFDEEEESELTVTQLRERAHKQKEELERRMLGDFSDGEDGGEEEGQDKKGQNKESKEEYGCTWGMDEDAAPEEDENEENPFSTEFHEDQEAAYLKDPKKALQGFYDREGEELEFEYEDKSHGTWLCRIKLPVDDAVGRQLVAEVTHTGKKKEAAVQCCLEACRMLEARGLLRQEAVSRKRKKKNWEDEDYYDSDDDTFLDRTGTVEKKRQERMKKAGKIEEKPDTYESLVAKLSDVEKQLGETQKKLSAGKRGSSSSSTEDSLEAFMTAVRSEAAMDAVERRKLHVHMADLRKEAQSLRKLVELTRPAQMPSLLPSGSSEKPKKTLPLFGAMKGGSKFKLKIGTIGKLPPKRPNLPAELFNMKELPPAGEEEEEDDVEEQGAEKMEDDDDGEHRNAKAGLEESAGSTSLDSTQLRRVTDDSQEVKESKAGGKTEPVSSPSKKRKVIGPSRQPVQLSGQYPQDDPDYSVWLPPAGQTGDGRTHLNDKYGY